MGDDGVMCSHNIGPSSLENALNYPPSKHVEPAPNNLNIHLFASDRLFFAVNILPHINKMDPTNGPTGGVGVLGPNGSLGSGPLGGPSEGLESFADTLAVEMLKGLEQLEEEQPGEGRAAVSRYY